MNETAIQLGVAGLAMVVTWKGLDFLRWYVEHTGNRKNSYSKASVRDITAGGQTVDFWIEKQEAGVARGFSTVIAPVLANQNLMFQRMEHNIQGMREDIREMRAQFNETYQHIVAIAARDRR
jgi:hypothetical protein